MASRDELTGVADAVVAAFVSPLSTAPADGATPAVVSVCDPLHPLIVSNESNPIGGGRLSFEYVRRYYGVPAKRGCRVVWDGKPGRLTSGNGHYVRVLLDGERRPRIVHPTWHMEYVDV